MLETAIGLTNNGKTYTTTLDLAAVIRIEDRVDPYTGEVLANQCEVTQRHGTCISVRVVAHNTSELVQHVNAYRERSGPRGAEA